MANGQDNLIPLNKRPKEVQREIQRKGNEASIKVKKQKASFKQAIKWLAESDIRITQGDIYETYKKQGVDISKFTPTELATMGLWLGAVTGKNENFKTLMEGNNETVQTSETPTVAINIIDNNLLEKALYVEDEEDETN